MKEGKGERKLREGRDKTPIGTYVENDYDQDGDEINPNELTKEEVAAVQADLNPFEMNAEEKRIFPQLESCDNYGVYIQIRNYILWAWQENLNQFLSLKTIEKSIQDKYKCIIAPTFDFLRRYGYINTGIVASPQMDFHSDQTFSHKRAKVVVVGAGMSGLAAARQLHHLGFEVIVVEGRNRVGGRVNTDWSFGGGVDLGASIVTGLEGNPLTNIFKQLGSHLHPLHHECPIFDVDGKQIDTETDQIVEKKFNKILDLSREESNSLSPSLGEAIDTLFKRESANEPKLSEEETKKRKRLFNWHVANLEYGCAINLNKVSTKNWDQDDSFDWAGSHCLLRDGYQTIAQEVAKGLDVRFDSKVTSIHHNRLGNNGNTKAIVSTQKEDIECDIVLVTVSLGVLKSKMVEFNPPLPQWKQKSIDNLGFGLLNKVALLFPQVFWNNSLDYFGQVVEDEPLRGEFYLFWNIHRAMDKPVLIALMAGDAAYHSETLEKNVVVSKVMNILRKQFGDIPEPVNSIVTKWGSDEFAKGTYSYISIDGSGRDYDILADPVDANLFFAGEATTRTHPATAAGAYLSGLRVAGDIYSRICGKIKIEFDYERLLREWTLENVKSSAKKKQQKRMRKKMEEERGRRFHQRGKTGVLVRKAKFNATYSWLFDSNYKIPKKAISTTLSSLPSSSVNRDSNSNTPQDQKPNFSPQKSNSLLDLLPTKRRPAPVITASNNSSSTPSTSTNISITNSTPSTPNTFSSPIQPSNSFQRDYKSLEFGRSEFSPKFSSPTTTPFPNNSSPFYYNSNVNNNSYQPNHLPPSQSSHIPSYNSYSHQQPSFNQFIPSPTLQYNPPIIAVSQNSTAKLSKEEKASVSNVVVGALTKALKSYSVSLEKEKFKHIARKLAHYCCEKNVSRFNRDGFAEEESKSKIRKVVQDYLIKRKERKKDPFRLN